MVNLGTLDYVVIAVYFSMLVSLGLYLRKRASASMEDYFLGGRRLPWWLIGFSGMGHFLDIAGTLIIISFLYLLGPRGLFIEFRGGAVLILPVWLLWAGKWHRRSGCMTGAEWMSFRFGNGLGGQFARVACAISRIALTVGMLAYMVKAVGLFFSMFLPFPPLVCALAMVGVASLYTMVSGFYGVVITDLVQASIIIVGVFIISIMAFTRIDSPESLGALAQSITGSADWLSSTLTLHTTMPPGKEYEAFQSIGMFAMFYLLRTLIGATGEADDPKYFGARSDRECGKLTFLWTWLVAFRWPMMMGFAVLGLFLIKELFPDQSVLAQAAQALKDTFPGIEKAQWADAVSSVRLSPEQFPDLVESLTSSLGADWANKLNMVGYEGGVDPERILPGVVLFVIPNGLRGLILVSLVAASMSTFDSTVNRGIGYFVRDIYQRYLRPRAATRELIYVSWTFGMGMVATGFLMGFYVRSVNQIWGWIIMGLLGGLLVPMTLRFFWWRFNGTGFAVGTLVGLTGAVTAKILADTEGFTFLGDDRWLFCATFTTGLIGTLVGTYLSPPTERAILEDFYRKTRPFGLWGPLVGILEPDTRAAMRREHRNDLLALPFNLMWQITLFLLPMQLVIHTYDSFVVTLVIFLVSLGGMYVFWFRHLSELSNEG